jgi:hypothetical protein
MPEEQEVDMKWMAFGTALLAAAVMQAPVAQAALLTFATSLSGAIEAPPNASPGTGTGFVTIDDVANTMRVQTEFSGLVSPTRVAHIHCCTDIPFDVTDTAIVATTEPTFPGFPTGVTSGTYDEVFNLLAASTYHPDFIAASGGTVAGARERLLEGLEEGTSYLNIHSELFRAGEIRGFLQQVPEPSSLLLLGAAFCGMLPFVRRRYSAGRA